MSGTLILAVFFFQLSWASSYEENLWETLSLVNCWLLPCEDELQLSVAKCFPQGNSSMVKPVLIKYKNKLDNHCIVQAMPIT